MTCRKGDHAKPCRGGDGSQASPPHERRGGDGTPSVGASRYGYILGMGESSVPDSGGLHEERGIEPSDRSLDTDTGTWVLQTEAAARTGSSISAIRKWRGQGLVAERTIISDTGMERVEVRLEDVLAMATLEPDRENAEAGVVDGDRRDRPVVLRFDDLEDLFERLFTAEQRAERAEAELASLRARPTSSMQTPDQRQESEGVIRQTRNQSRMAPPQPTTPPPMQARQEAPAQPRLAESRPGGTTAAAGNVPVSERGMLAGGATRHTSGLEELGIHLRASYARLDQYRREDLATAATEREWRRELAEYDRLLVDVCAALHIPTGLAAGEQVNAETRAALTRALARAGLDVRADVRASTSARPQRVPWKRGFQ
jgi:hypothetical protein